MILVVNVSLLFSNHSLSDLRRVSSVLRMGSFFLAGLFLSACDLGPNDAADRKTEITAAMSLHSFEGPTMGSSYHVKVALTPQQLDQKDQLATKISALLVDIENKMSTYLPQSELSRFNAAPVNSWLAMSDDLLAVVTQAVTMGQQSEGAYDITVGPLVNLWGFGPDIHEDKVPSQTEINEAIQKLGTHKLLIDAPNKRWQKTAPVYVDLSSIDQGYAADKVVKLLQQQGIRHAMVEIAGEIRTIGSKTPTQPWRIAIESPTTNVRTVKRIVNVNDVALATSGDYRNYFEKDGKRYSHIIDPRTGYPISHTLASVTVIAKEDIVADVHATTLMVLGPDKGWQFAQDKGLAVLMIIRTEQGFEERFTEQFRQYLEAE